MTSHLNHTALVSTNLWTHYTINNFTLPLDTSHQVQSLSFLKQGALVYLPSCKKDWPALQKLLKLPKDLQSKHHHKISPKCHYKKMFNSEITEFWSTQFLKIENNLKKCKNWPVFLENISYFSIMSQRRRYLHNWLSFSYFFCIKTIQLWKSEERITPNFRSLLTDKQMHPEGEGYF